MSTKAFVMQPNLVNIDKQRAFNNERRNSRLPYGFPSLLDHPKQQGSLWWYGSVLSINDHFWIVGKIVVNHLQLVRSLNQVFRFSMVIQ